MGQLVPSETRPTNGAANLFLARRAAGWSLAELAAHTGVPVEALRLFEDGWVDLWDEDKADIARALSVPASLLWGGSSTALAAWLEGARASA
jgi:transcriptional regulator with XRE-family HTH domain